jgi:hypothetical protein
MDVDVFFFLFLDKIYNCDVESRLVWHRCDKLLVGNNVDS